MVMKLFAVKKQGLLSQFVYILLCRWCYPWLENNWLFHVLLASAVKYSSNAIKLNFHVILCSPRLRGQHSMSLEEIVSFDNFTATYDFIYVWSGDVVTYIGLKAMEIIDKLGPGAKGKEICHRRKIMIKE